MGYKFKNKIILKDSHEIKINHEIDDAKQLFDIINLVKNVGVRKQRIIKWT